MPAHDDLAELKTRVQLSHHVARKVKLSSPHGGDGGDRFGCCPFHDERTPSFTVNDAKGFFHCFGCGAHGDILDWWQKAEGLSFAEARDRLKREAGAGVSPRRERQQGLDINDDRKRRVALAIWAETRPIAGTPAERYLRSIRRISIDLPPTLRFHPGLRFEHGNPETLPAMVAAVVDQAGEVVAIQRTFLSPDGGGKARIEQPKRSLGSLGNASVRLAPAAPVLGIAEGIETGLSAMELFRLPVWCALGSNLGRLALPALVHRVVIFADHGDAGVTAAEKAATTFRQQRRKVAIEFPTLGKDFNDQLRGVGRD